MKFLIDNNLSPLLAVSLTAHVRLAFAPRNDLGVLDPYLTLNSGAIIYVPMRVIADESGSEVVFTVRRRPGMTEDEFEADGDAVAATAMPWPPTSQGSSAYLRSRGDGMTSRARHAGCAVRGGDLPGATGQNRLGPAVAQGRGGAL